ncbi:MAG: AMP-binding protein, partial [Ktedonobacteraceae bacterium]|nr:AMP-binding protein [Ktedonobacteraceae bacterium]
GQALQSYTPSEFDAVCMPTHTPGEIVVSGGHVLPGYVNGRGDEETKFRVDNTIWHRTGDMGYLDTQGRLWLLGRCAARIKDQHGTLYPFTVECAISSHSAIRRSAVAAFHKQRILALELEKHAPSPDLQAIDRSVAWANFDAIRIYKHLPVDKRHNAKIDYPALSQLLEADLSAHTAYK